MIHFACPTCGRKIQAADTLVGQIVSCPACGEVIQVLAPGSEPPPLFVGTDEPTPHHRSALVPILIVACLAGVAGLGVAAVVLLGDRSTGSPPILRPPPPDRPAPPDNPDDPTVTFDKDLVIAVILNESEMIVQDGDKRLWLQGVNTTHVHDRQRVHVHGRFQPAGEKELSHSNGPSRVFYVYLASGSVEIASVDSVEERSPLPLTADERERAQRELLELPRTQRPRTRQGEGPVPKQHPASSGQRMSAQWLDTVDLLLDCARVQARAGKPAAARKTVAKARLLCASLADDPWTKQAARDRMAEIEQLERQIR